MNIEQRTVNGKQVQNYSFKCNRIRQLCNNCIVIGAMIPNKTYPLTSTTEAVAHRNPAKQKIDFHRLAIF